MISKNVLPVRFSRALHRHHYNNNYDDDDQCMHSRARAQAMILDLMLPPANRTVPLHERVLVMVAPQLLALLGRDDFATLAAAADRFLEDSEFLWELLIE